MTKTVLIILAALALVGGGVWFYLQSVTQKSDINYIGVPGQVMPPTRVPDSSLQPKGSPSPSSTVNKAPSPSRSPSATPSRYVGPGEQVN